MSSGFSNRMREKLRKKVPVLSLARQVALHALQPLSAFAFDEAGATPSRLTFEATLFKELLSFRCKDEFFAARLADQNLIFTVGAHSAFFLSAPRPGTRAKFDKQRQVPVLRLNSEVNSFLHHFRFQNLVRTRSTDRVPHTSVMKTGGESTHTPPGFSYRLYAYLQPSGVPCTCRSLAP